ncbi:MAG: type II secretion system protein, partial [Rickettsiales bacterium]
AKPKSITGFSLVELSIVLVILGLLVGGILSGQSLIRAAELRAVGTEYARYLTATHTFRDKYFALPGDMNNAINFWGAAHATPATCTTTLGTGTQTCNGDGDGRVLDCGYEAFRYWQQLANAGLIEGQYTGVQDATACNHTLGVNAPRSKISNAGWSFGYIDFLAGDAGTYGMNYGNTLWFGADTPNRTQYAVIKPEEAWNLDTKMDDGKPARGKIIARPEGGGAWGTATNCTTSANQTDYTGDYRLSNSTTSCSFMIKAD